MRRVRARVYAPLDEWNALTPWDRYLARVHAVAIARPGSVFCLESAAVLLGVPIVGEPRDIHVVDTARRSSNRHADVFIHVSRESRAIVEAVGMSAVATTHTVLDLVRVLPPAYGLAAVDAAISGQRLAATSVDELARIVGEQIGRRGRRSIDWVLEHADPRSESVGESVSRAVIEWLGYPKPDLQCTFRFEGAVDRTDFFWREQGVAGESDGYGKYDATDGAAMKAHFVAEKRREDRLRRHLDGFARWDWHDAVGVTGLDSILAARLPRVRPREESMLLTLATHPRTLPRTSGLRNTPPDAETPRSASFAAH